MALNLSHGHREELLVSEDILFDIWDKFAVNISRNLPQAVIDVGAGAYDDSVYLKDVENRLREALGLRTTLKGNRKHGKIILQYYTEEELEQLYQCLEKLK